MSVILAWLGVAMIAIGISAIYSGSLVFTFERGWTMVVSGTVAGSAGAIVVGLSAALRRLRRIEAEAVKLRETLAAWGGTVASQAAAAPAAPPIPAEELGTGEPSGTAAIADGGDAEPCRVVGSYAAGGNSYVMFADGSIRAETPSGQHRFDSMDAFKVFMLTSALRPDRDGKGGVAGKEPQAAGSPAALSAKA